MALAANVSKPKTISKTRAGSIRTVELKGPLPKAMNIGDGAAKKYDLMGQAALPKAFTADGPSDRPHPGGPVARKRQQNRPRVWSPAKGGCPSVGGGQ